MTSTDPGRRPCIIGVAQRTWRDLEAPEPFEQWAQMAQAAAHDAGAPHALRTVDDVTIIYADSWRYDDAPRRLADRLDLYPGNRREGLPAGTSHQEALNAAAGRLIRGEITVALVAGGEAMATKAALIAAGEPLGWSHPAASQLPVFDRGWFLPSEWSHRVLNALGPFGLLATAQRARLGLDPEAYTDRLAGIVADGSEVAAKHDQAWFPEIRFTDEIATVTRQNRLVASPLTKLMCAYPLVDQASATLLTTDAHADSLGVPRDRRVYLRGWGYARDAAHIAARPEIGASPAITRAVGAALTGAGVGLDDLALLDLYGCFPNAVDLAADAIGFDIDDRRGWTVTGGLACFGGPLANTMGHGIATLVDRLREDPGDLGMVTGIGLHAVKHVAGVYSSEPGPLDVQLAADAAAEGPEPATLPVTDVAAGPATIAALTVLVERGHARRLLAVCDLPDGSRCYATSEDEPVIDASLAGEWVGRSVQLTTDDGVNTLRIA